MADGSVYVTIKVDLTGFTASMGRLAESFTSLHQSRERRYRAQVAATLRGSRMRSAYRARTRRRNRRG